MRELDDEPEPDDDTSSEEQRDEHDELICPECGSSFASRGSVTRHMLRKHGKVLPRKPRETKTGTEPAPRRARSGGRRDTRKTKVSQTIVRAVDLYEQRDGTVDGIAATLRKDASKIAGFVAGVADYFTPLGVLIDKTLGDGGLLDGALSFAGVFRAVQARVSGRRDERQRIQQLYEQRYNELLEREGEDAANEYARQVDAGELTVA